MAREVKLEAAVVWVGVQREMGVRSRHHVGSHHPKGLLPPDDATRTQRGISTSAIPDSDT